MNPKGKWAEGRGQAKEVSPGCLTQSSTARETIKEMEGGLSPESKKGFVGTRNSCVRGDQPYKGLL
jgi:hypothetical protein